MEAIEHTELRKWAKRQQGWEMMDDRTSVTDFFFLDELDKDRIYISISVGDVWLYFWMEILIGVRDLRNNHAAFLKINPNITRGMDGYSHRHLITPEIVAGAMNEVYPNKVQPRMLSASELQALAFEWVSDSIVKHVERELTFKR